MFHLSIAIFVVCTFAYIEAIQNEDDVCLKWALRRLGGKQSNQCNATYQVTSTPNPTNIKGPSVIRTGRPGKRGPIGPPGVQGLPGPRGPEGTCECDLGEVRTLREENNEFRKEMSIYEAKIERLETKQIILSRRIDKALWPGWTKASNDYYYRVFEATANYTTARDNCVNIGARLASAGLRNESIQREIYRSLISPLNARVWIGLDDIGQEGRFVWSDGVVADRSNTNWKPGQPDDNIGREDCGEYHPLFGNQFNDAGCSFQHAYMCEAIEDD